MILKHDNYWKTKSFDYPPLLHDIKNIDRSLYVYSLCTLTSKSTEFIYFFPLKYLREENEPWTNSKRLRDATIEKPEQFLSICPALYDDIIIYGKEDFDVSIHCTKTTKENVLYSKEWHEERTELTYNDFENETFKGIKCIETGQLFDTVGQAAKAVGLKSKSSILKCLNNSNKTAAKYHWASLEKQYLPAAAAVI